MMETIGAGQAARTERVAIARAARRARNAAVGRPTSGDKVGSDA
jgi:hypothetical protein